PRGAGMQGRQEADVHRLQVQRHTSLREEGDHAAGVLGGGFGHGGGRILRNPPRGASRALEGAPHPASVEVKGGGLGATRRGWLPGPPRGRPTRPPPRAAFLRAWRGSRSRVSTLGSSFAWICRTRTAPRRQGRGR